MDPDVLYPLAAALEAHKVDYVLVGGVAMGMQGLARATKDIDLFVRLDEANLERLRQALDSVYHDPCIREIDSADLMGDYPVVRYGPPTGDYLIDILGRLGEVWTYEALETETVVIRGIPIHVATPRTLVRMKRDTLRPRDQIDVQALREHYGLEDV